MDVLNKILNEGEPSNEQPEQSAEVQEGHGEAGGSEGGEKPSSKPSEKTYEGLEWDEDDENKEENEEEEGKAPDQVDDKSEEELAKIEERNKWMKGRLAPVKEKLSKAEQELAALRAENEALKAGKAPEKQEETPAPQNHQSLDEYINAHPAVKELSDKLKELDAKADDMTEKEYVDAKMDILSDLKLTKRELSNQIRYAQEAQMRQVQEAESKIEKDYDSAVLARKEDYPDIDKALNRVKKNAANLDVNIRGMLVFDGDKINQIGRAHV